LKLIYGNNKRRFLRGGNMRQGIKEKDIRDFEKYAQKLSAVMSRICEYKPEANAFLACEGRSTVLNLMSDDHCDYPRNEQQSLIVTEIDMVGFDGGGW
jgi:hypothetical protein